MPAAGKPTMNKIEKNFHAFIDAVYTENGDIDKNAVYPKIPLDNNCRFCEFNNRPDWLHIPLNGLKKILNDLTNSE
jgi:hypothetical protein